MKDTNLDQCAFLTELELQLEEQEKVQYRAHQAHKIVLVHRYMVLITSEAGEFRPQENKPGKQCNTEHIKKGRQDGAIEKGAWKQNDDPLPPIYSCSGFPIFCS